MEFEGQSVLVLGLGVSGRGAVRFLAERGARVVAADERAEPTIEGLDSLPGHVELRVGEAFPELADFDLVVPSPGVPESRYRGLARRAWGDIELCYRALSIPIIAVTGTNGKSTVVKLIEAMARAAGLRARAAGNIGLPALELVGQPLDIAILEVSSFQLESVDAFAPRTGVLLNITPDHLDRHGDLRGYCEAKARLFARQSAGQTAIVNGDDPLCRDMPIPPSAERLEFRRHSPVEQGAWLDGSNMLLRRGQGPLQTIPLGGGAELAGQYENILAALLALATVDADLEAAAMALVDFEGLPHRCQTIATRRGVRYVDDSKATNVGAAVRSIASVSGELIWIAGGRHKGGDLTPLAKAARGRVRRALLIGESASEFDVALGHEIDCEIVGNLESAVRRASAIAHDGDAVLLAPACASFDQFASFEARGHAFAEAVGALSEHASKGREESP